MKIEKQQQIKKEAWDRLQSGLDFFNIIEKIPEDKIKELPSEQISRITSLGTVSRETRANHNLTYSSFIDLYVKKVNVDIIKQLNYQEIISNALHNNSFPREFVLKLLDEAIEKATQKYEIPDLILVSHNRLSEFVICYKKEFGEYPPVISWKKEIKVYTYNNIPIYSLKNIPLSHVYVINTTNMRIALPGTHISCEDNSCLLSSFGGIISYKNDTHCKIVDLDYRYT